MFGRRSHNETQSQDYPITLEGAIGVDERLTYEQLLYLEGKGRVHMQDLDKFCVNALQRAYGQFHKEREFYLSLGNDTTGINVERAMAFLGKIGAIVTPIHGVSSNDFDTVLIAAKCGTPPPDDGEATGIFIDEANIALVRRGGRYEKSVGPGVVEATIVHDGVHTIGARRRLALDLVPGTKRKPWTATTRRGPLMTRFTEFSRAGLPLHSGMLLEEAYATYIAGKYIEEALNLPEGFSSEKWDTLPSEATPLRVLRKYIYPYERRKGEVILQTNRYAGLAAILELIARRDSGFLPALHAAGDSDAAVAEVRRRMNETRLGLYETIVNREYERAYNREEGIELYMQLEHDLIHHVTYTFAPLCDSESLAL